MAVVYLGLGSNMGDREAYLKQAIRELETRGVHLRQMSSVIETDPVGGPPQGKFLNAVAECATALSPDELLLTIQAIEQTIGRVKTVVDGPRVIDLDILLYDQIKIRTAHLTIPHPRMRSRSFVMTPLREIALQIAKEIERCEL